MARSGGLIPRVLEEVATRAGMAMVDGDRLDLLESSDRERRALEREMDLLAYTALDYFGNQPHDQKAVERRKSAQKSRVAWMNDAQAGAAIDLLNDFCLGRGIPQPKCHDPVVQEVLDEAWNDPDNQLALTSFQAQVALNTDLSLQSNLFMLMFNQGKDGKVKLSILNHDSVENVVRDPDNRLRILYYVARPIEQAWDFVNDAPKPVVPQGTEAGKPKLLYYEHWQNVEDAGPGAPKPPKQKLGEGRVYHVSINRSTEQAFGVPEMQRTLRWFSAYNSFMEARVDQARAAAAFSMKRKVKGGPEAIQKMAARALSRRSELSQAQSIDPPPTQGGPRPASILEENDSVTHEDFSINTNAGNALTDGQMLRSQISAATHFPQHYLGDAGSANLATATSMELPVLKHVESRQEVLEQLFRWFIDRVIEAAVDAGRIPAKLTPEELALQKQDEANPGGDDAAALGSIQDPAEQADNTRSENPYALQQAYETQGQDEQDIDRDLGYDFGLPSPLRRTMTDLVTAVTGIASTFDPNGVNLEMQRILLTVVLGEALEIQDPGAAVEQIFPPGYQDPILAAQLAAQQAQQQAAQQQTNGLPPGFTLDTSGAPQGENNPYSAPMNGSTPEQNPYMQQAWDNVTDVAARELKSLEEELLETRNGHG